MNTEPAIDTQAKVEQDLALYAAIMGSAATAIILLNDVLELICMNTAAEQFLQTSANRLSHQPFDKAPGVKPQLMELLETCLKKNQAYTQREMQWQSGAGDLTTLDLAVTPIQMPAGQGLLLELQRLDRFLKISKEESIWSIHQANRALVRGLAHEVKNPLGGIKGAAQLLSKAMVDKGYSDYTQVIINEADRLTDLVDRMLGPRQILQLESVNIHEVLERVKALLDAETEFNIKIERNYDFSLPLIQADMNQLIQAFLNIARNAIQAIQESNTTTALGRIRFVTRIARQQTINGKLHRLAIRVCVEDNGPGIPVNLLETLFYPLVSGRAEGSGLGLAISQAVIQQHQGMIECQSEPGCTQFHIFIPLEVI